LPPEKVKEAWGILKSEFDDDEIDLVTYSEENYVVGKIRMRFRKKEATRYEPCFPIDMWSVQSNCERNAKNIQFIRRLAQQNIWFIINSSWYTFVYLQNSKRTT
jgi:hypothetical protein